LSAREGSFFARFGSFMAAEWGIWHHADPDWVEQAIADLLAIKASGAASADEAFEWIFGFGLPGGERHLPNKPASLGFYLLRRDLQSDEANEFWRWIFSSESAARGSLVRSFLDAPALSAPLAALRAGALGRSLDALKASPSQPWDPLWLPEALACTAAMDADGVDEKAILSSPAGRFFARPLANFIAGLELERFGSREAVLAARAAAAPVFFERAHEPGGPLADRLHPAALQWSLSVWAAGGWLDAERAALWLQNATVVLLDERSSALAVLCQRADNRSKEPLAKGFWSWMLRSGAWSGRERAAAEPCLDALQFSVLAGNGALTAMLCAAQAETDPGWLEWRKFGGARAAGLPPELWAAAERSALAGAAGPAAAAEPADGGSHRGARPRL
jgi:hypothetical protein